MKKIAIIILSLFLLLPSIGNMMVYFSFKINQNEISKTLCIQKEAKYNTCNGRCVLDLRLKSLEDKQEKNEIIFKKIASIEYVEILPSFEFENALISNFKTDDFPIVADKLTSNFIIEILHPPAVV